MVFIHPPLSATTTACNRSPTLSPRLDIPAFLPSTKMKREVWLLRTWFGIAPVNKLVSLTWLLWVLRSFQRFTLHYVKSSASSWVVDFVSKYFRRHDRNDNIILAWKLCWWVTVIPVSQLLACLMQCVIRWCCQKCWRKKWERRKDRI